MADLESQNDEKSRLRETETTENDCYTKEELLELSNTPGWNIARKVLLGVFWLCWFGMIAWSVIIVIQAPKCKKEPEQAWFTKGAIATLDCATLELAEIPEQMATVEAGQYEGIIATNCADEAEKSAALVESGSAKDIKMLFAIDASSDTEVANTPDVEGASGYIFLNAADVEFALNVTTEEPFIFIEGKTEIPDNAKYYRRVSDDSLDSVKDWLGATMKYNETMQDVDIPVWTITTGTETLWEAQQAMKEDGSPSAAMVLSSILPGGFVVPLESSADAVFVDFGRGWRREYQSLRAIDGSEMRWFDRGTGFSRKFDLQPAIEVVVNLAIEQGVELEAVRGSLDQDQTATRIYPEETENDKFLNKGEVQVFKVD